MFNSLLTELRGQAAMQAEIIALRHQLTVLQRSRSRMRHSNISIVACGFGYPDSGRVGVGLIIVKPETVIGWHRQGFRWYWTWKVRHGQSGRPQVPKEARDLIRTISRASETRRHNLASFRCQIHGPKSEATISDMENVSRQPECEGKVVREGEVKCVLIEVRVKKCRCHFHYAQSRRHVHSSLFLHQGILQHYYAHDFRNRPRATSSGRTLRASLRLLPDFESPFHDLV
jgi:hypothetical protein